MAKKFVRTITDTDIKKEPFHTNKQNDILSDEKDVYIRNKEEYHCLTDNIKTIKSDNEEVKISRYKNNATINIDFPSGKSSIGKVLSPLQVKEGVNLSEKFLLSYSGVMRQIRRMENNILSLKTEWEGYDDPDIILKGIELNKEIGTHYIDLMNCVKPPNNSISVKLSLEGYKEELKDTFRDGQFHNSSILILENSTTLYGEEIEKVRPIKVTIESESMLICLDENNCEVFTLENIYSPEGKKLLPMDITVKPGEVRVFKLDIGKDRWGIKEIVGLMEEL